MPGPVTVTPKPRDQPRLPVRFSSRKGVDSLTDALGRFHRASVTGGQVVYRRADTNVPVGGVWAVETGLGDGTSEPSLAQDRQDLELRSSVAYARGDAGAGAPLPGVYECRSDDDAFDFEPERLMLPDAKHPRNVSSPYTGERLLAGFLVGPPGTIQAVYRGPADLDWSAPFTFQDGAGAPLLVKDDSFSITLWTEPGLGLIRWVLSVVIDGETEVSEWTSEREPDFGSPSMLWERVS